MTTTTKTLEQQKNEFKPLGEVIDNDNESTPAATAVIEVSTYELEFDKIDDIQEAGDYLRKTIDKHDTFQFITKARLIRMYAEKYKKLEYPILEIIDEICKQLGNRVERHYVSKILPTEYKNKDKVHAGKVSREKVKEKKREEVIPEWHSDGGDSDHEENMPSLEINNFDIVDHNSVKGDHIDILKSQIQFRDEKIISLEAIIADQKQQILALNGTIRYSDSIFYEKWHKMDKASSLKLDSINKAATSEIYVLVDIRDGHIIKAITDKEYDKMMRNKNKN